VKRKYGINCDKGKRTWRWKVPLIEISKDNDDTHVERNFGARVERGVDHDHTKRRAGDR